MLIIIINILFVQKMYNNTRHSSGV